MSKPRQRSRSRDRRDRDHGKDRRREDDRKDRDQHRGKDRGQEDRDRREDQHRGKDRRREDDRKDRDQHRGKDRGQEDRDRREDQQRGKDRRREDDRKDRRDDQRRGPVDPAAVWGAMADERVAGKRDDPRARGPLGKAQRAALGLGVATGRNTESFDPKSTLVRPSMRVIVANGKKSETYDKPLKHDDVVIVPEYFCDEEDWSIYYKLVEEMRESQEKAAPGARNGPEWLSWHEGAHLISKDPSGSATYREVQKKMGDFFRLRPNSRGTRFNWYNQSSDWKPFHHDSAAFNPQRARNQNCTVGVSFGDTRELSFVDANDPSKRFYFPQTNGSLFYFGRDVNLRFKHGVNYQPEGERTGKGRISIILWGWADAVDEGDSPPMLTNETRPQYDGRRKR